MSYRMKKIAAILGAGVLTFSMIACSNETVEKVNSSNKTSESVSDTLTYASADSLLEVAKLDGSEMFSDLDKEIGYDETTSTDIILDDAGSTCTEKSVKISDGVITITEEGTYVISGSLSEGQIVVDSDEAKVQLVLDNASITNDDSAAIYVKSADKVIVTLADGSDNTLATTGEFSEEDNINGVIFSKSDITFNGKGFLTINSACGNGIVSKDDLKVTGGNYTITAANHGLKGKDSVRIADGVFYIEAGKDGIHSENSDDSEKGFVYIADGTFTITCDGDGIDASYIVQIDNGEFDIVSGGGSENAQTKSENNWFGGNRGQKMDGMTPPSDAGQLPEGMTSPTDENAQTTDRPQRGQMPEGMTPPSGDGQMPEGMTPPSGDNQMPEGMTPPSGDGQMPEGMTPPTSDTTTADTTTSDEETVSTKGIKADVAIFINAGTITIDACDDAIHSNGGFQIDDGILTLASGDDGIHADSALYVNGGSIEVSKSYEGIEGLTITIADGNISVTASDDGLNAAGGNDQSGFAGFGADNFGASEDCWIQIDGGYLYVNASGDGIDSNGDLNITGGEIYVDGPSDSGNAAVDYGDGATATITGGSLIAVGGSGMAENFSSDSSQGAILYIFDSALDGEKVTLCDEEGNEILSFDAARSYDSVLISCAELEEGKTYLIKTESTTETIELSSLVYANKTGGFMGGGRKF